MSQMNPVNTTPSCFSKSHFTIIPHLRLGLPSGLFPSGYPTKILYTFIFSPTRATGLSHLIYLIILIIFGEQFLLCLGAFEKEVDGDC
jgi:hypothetical protein